MTKPRYEERSLRIGEVPAGKGWEIHSGNLEWNSWRRRRPVRRRPQRTRDELVKSIQRLTSA